MNNVNMNYDPYQTKHQMRLMPEPLNYRQAPVETIPAALYDLWHKFQEEGMPRKRARKRAIKAYITMNPKFSGNIPLSLDLARKKKLWNRLTTQ